MCIDVAGLQALAPECIELRLQLDRDVFKLCPFVGLAGLFPEKSVGIDQGCNLLRWRDGPPAHVRPLAVERRMHPDTGLTLALNEGVETMLEVRSRRHHAYVADRSAVDGVDDRLVAPGACAEIVRSQIDRNGRLRGCLALLVGSFQKSWGVGGVGLAGATASDGALTFEQSLQYDRRGFGTESRSI